MLVTDGWLIGWFVDETIVDWGLGHVELLYGYLVWSLVLKLGRWDVDGELNDGPDHGPCHNVLSMWNGRIGRRILRPSIWLAFKMRFSSERMSPLYERSISSEIYSKD